MIVAAVVAALLVPPFAASVHPVTRTDLRYSYRPGCPVGPADLRLIRLRYWGFDNESRMGEIVVHRTVVGDVRTVFRRLYAARFPIRRLRTIEAYGGNDSRSTAADNTAGFNCRNAISAGPPHWSMHAYGEAIDVNPVENPYVFGGLARPRAGAKYLDRANVRPGMAVPGGILVEAFAAVGWKWGGRWSSPDYQHFSTTGR